ncbi:MAG: hypothetical protein AVDCRST_MAG59-3957, partial [uncultured Thermomicrobiales bacterium]
GRPPRRIDQFVPRLLAGRGAVGDRRRRLQVGRTGERAGLDRAPAARRRRRRGRPRQGPPGPTRPGTGQPQRPLRPRHRRRRRPVPQGAAPLPCLRRRHGDHQHRGPRRLLGGKPGRAARGVPGADRPARRRGGRRRDHDLPGDARRSPRHRRDVGRADPPHRQAEHRHQLRRRQRHLLRRHPAGGRPDPLGRPREAPPRQGPDRRRRGLELPHGRHRRGRLPGPLRHAGEGGLRRPLLGRGRVPGRAGAAAGGGRRGDGRVVSLRPAVRAGAV